MNSTFIPNTPRPTTAGTTPVIEAARIDVRATIATVAAPAAMPDMETQRRIDQMAAVDAGRVRRAEVARQVEQASLPATMPAEVIPTAELAATADVGGMKGATIDKARAAMEGEARAKKENDDLDAARRLIDREYRYRKEKEEEFKRFKEADTRAAEARKEVVSAGDLALSTADPFLRKAQQDANAARQQREEDKRVDAARRTVDPEYARQQATMDVRRGVGNAQMYAQAGQMAGVPGAGALGNALQGAQIGASLGGPVGAAVGATVAAGVEFKKTLESAAEEAGKFAKALASSDVDQFQRQVVDVTRKLPLLGEGIAMQLDIARSVHQSLVGEAERLKGFSAALSVNAARIDTARIARDQERAQAFEPQLLAAQNASLAAEEQLYQLQLKYLPTVARFAEIGMKKLDEAVTFLDNILTANVRTLESLINLVPEFGGARARAEQALAALRRLVSNTDPNAEAFEAEDFTTQLLGTVRPFMAADEEARRAAQLAAEQDQQRERQRREGLFPGL